MVPMEIDGSYGEGGGQLVRFAIALSAMLGEDVTIVNIRAGRTTPGIRPQHLAAINAVARLASAKVKGNEVGSSSVSFSPGRITGGQFDFDVGTAGSVTLVLQAVLPVALMAEKPVSGRIVGGTEVRWSPTVDYFDRVFLRGVRTMGADVSVKLLKSGYYPRGGGVVHFSVTPRSQLDPLITPRRLGGELRVSGVSRCANLPQAVAERQASSARDLLRKRNITVDEIEIVHTSEPLGPGSSITLWVNSEPASFIGADSIGERGKRAEVVGSEAAESLIKCVDTGSGTDEHFADMILPYMFKAKGRSRVTTPRISKHLMTEVHIAKLFDVPAISIDDSTVPAELSVTPKEHGIV